MIFDETLKDTHTIKVLQNNSNFNPKSDENPVNFTEYSPQLIAWLYSFRGKIWQEVEWHQLMENHTVKCNKKQLATDTFEPINDFSQQKNLTQIDPSMALTQSKKFWFANIPKQIVTHFSNPSMFRLQSTAQGISTPFGFAATAPLWATQVHSSTAFFNQVKFWQLQPLFTSICGVRSVRVCGSHFLGVATNSSDVDVVVFTRFGMTLYARFWLKFLLKITGCDIHSLRWEIINRVSLLFGLKHFLKISIAKQAAFHARSGLKIDAGIITDSPQNLHKIYSYTAQNAWLWGINLNAKKDSESANINDSGRNLPSPVWVTIMCAIVWFFSVILLPVLYPVVVVGQLAWSRWLRGSAFLSFRQCTFFTQDFPPEQKHQRDW